MSNMVKTVHIIKSENVVKITDIGNCFESKHITTLRAIDFKKKTSSENEYICMTSSDDRFISVCNYLKREGFEIDSDATTLKKLDDVDKIIEDYKRVKKLGSKIKKKKQLDLIPPPNFNPKIKIKSYQIKSIRHMLDVTHAANFSVPGSGKTLMTYAVYDILKSYGIIDSMLVIGPIASFGPWEDEYEFCMGKNHENKILRYHGSSRRRHLPKIKDYDVILTTYPTASNDIEHLMRHLMKKNKVMMVIDESHHIKSIDHDATFATSMIDLGENAERRYILTGTPMPHSFKDLWSQITFLWPTIKILQTRESFKQILENYRGKETISEMISFLWTRVTNKHLKNDLPKILKEENILVPMSETQEAIYAGVERDMWNTKHLDSDTINVIRYKKNRILRLMQAASNPNILLFKDDQYNLDKFNSLNLDLNSNITNYHEISPKIKRAAELALEITKKNANVVIWTVFVKNVDMLCDEIKRQNPNSDPLWISGDVPTGDVSSDSGKYQENREDRINEFKNSKGRILVATVGSIAESISLHKECHRAIYLERSYNAGQYMQSLSRIYRIGSDKKKPVQFIFLHSVFSDGKTRTIDNKIDGRLKDRIREMHKLLDDEFDLHPLELETSSNIVGESSEIYADNETMQLDEEIEKMVKEHEKMDKI